MVATLAELMEELKRRREPSERLRELRPATSLERKARRVSSGWPDLDRLCGGWPLGGVSEVVAAGSGGGLLLLASLRAAVERGESCALLDPHRGFDPVSAQASGLLLDRLLWVCPGDGARAARAAELLLESGGFALLALDLRSGTLQPPASPLPTSVWLRLARRARVGGVPLLVFSSRVCVHAPSLSLRVECAPRWQGELRGLDLRFQLRRGGT